MINANLLRLSRQLDAHIVALAVSGLTFFEKYAKTDARILSAPISKLNRDNKLTNKNYPIETHARSFTENKPIKYKSTLAPFLMVERVIYIIYN